MDRAGPHQWMVRTVFNACTATSNGVDTAVLTIHHLLDVLLQVGRRFGNGPALNASAQDRAGIRALYGDSADHEGLCDEAPMYSEADETGERDTIAPHIRDWLCTRTSRAK